MGRRAPSVFKLTVHENKSVKVLQTASISTSRPVETAPFFNPVLKFGCEETFDWLKPAAGMVAAALSGKAHNYCTVSSRTNLTCGSVSHSPFLLRV